MNNWPRIDVAVDAVVFGISPDKKTSILLIQRKHEPFKNNWALPGGFVDKDEDLEDAVRRELKEETGIDIESFTQLRAFGAPNRDPRKRVISIAHYTIINRDKFEPKANDDAADTKWFPIDELPELAFDHEEIIDLTISKIKTYITDTQKLRFDFLRSLGNQFGMTILPGRNDRNRELKEDITAIQSEGFKSVLTMITDGELIDYGVPNLLEEYNKAGLNVLRVIIPDQGVPTVQEMDEICKWLDDEVKKNNKVLVHCVGGLGRTGTVAASYLKAYCGYNTQQAISEVRLSRSQSAIETKIQEEFVAKYKKEE